MGPKSIKTEALFTKTGINNRRNINFLQNMWVQKVLRQKQYNVSKSIETEAVFTETEMKQSFLKNMRYTQKVLRLKLYLPKQELIIEEILIFIKICGSKKY